MSDYFPVEVILEILRRLPVKSLVKCRSVCRTWDSLIKNPSFISTHLQTSLSIPNTPLFLLKLLGDDKDQYFLHFDNDNFDEFKQLHFPFESSLHRFEVVSSCNGLVCLLGGSCPKDTGKFLLWNPSIQKYITLPSPNPNPNYLDERPSKISFGFGYDSKTNDFRVVRMLAYDEFTDLTYADLFSLNGNSWKKVTASSPAYKTEKLMSSTFVNGAVHWIGFKRGKNGGFKFVVLGFDISSEDFFVIQLPESLVSSSSTELYMSVMKYEESSIAVLKRWDDFDQLDLWVMKEYGIVGSWTKVLHLTYAKFVTRVLGFRKNEKVLLEVYGNGMASLDLNSQKIEYLRIKGESWYSTVVSYVESLVLLDKGIDTSNMIMQIV